MMRNSIFVTDDYLNKSDILIVFLLEELSEARRVCVYNASAPSDNFFLPVLEMVKRFDKEFSIHDE